MQYAADAPALGPRQPACEPGRSGVLLRLGKQRTEGYVRLLHPIDPTVLGDGYTAPIQYRILADGEALVAWVGLVEELPNRHRIFLAKGQSRMAREQGRVVVEGSIAAPSPRLDGGPVFFALELGAPAAALEVARVGVAAGVGEPLRPLLMASPAGGRAGLSALPDWVRKVSLLCGDAAWARAVAAPLARRAEVELIAFRPAGAPAPRPLSEDPADPLPAGLSLRTFEAAAFPALSETLVRALHAIDGDAICALGQRLPSLGLALLANYHTGKPIVLERGAPDGDGEPQADAGFPGDGGEEKAFAALLAILDEAPALLPRELVRDFVYPVSTRFAEAFAVFQGRLEAAA